MDIKLLIWNANGLNRHALELKELIKEKDIDIIMISETHFTNKSHIKIKDYRTYLTNHPDGTGHGGTAIIIKNKIKHIELEQYNTAHIQATSIQIEDNKDPITISALYCPPKHMITTTQFDHYLKSLGHKFIAAGDFNAKHTDWGSRLTNKKGKMLLDAIRTNHCLHISTGEPTYWPTDPSKIPDLIDFSITKNIRPNDLKIRSISDLSSDHSPILLQYEREIMMSPSNLKPYNRRTDWDSFRENIQTHLRTKIPLKSQQDIERAIVYLNDMIIESAYIATPKIGRRKTQQYTSSEIRHQIKEKRKLRKRWQTTRSPIDKQKLNKATKELKETLNKVENDRLTNYLRNLTPTSETNYSLWKATKTFKNETLHQPPLKRADGT